MAEITYSLCALTALLCSILLVRAYRTSRSRLLFWSALCFAGFTLNNLVILLDVHVFPIYDLSPWRLSIGVLSVAVLLYGLIFEDR